MELLQFFIRIEFLVFLVDLTRQVYLGLKIVYFGAGKVFSAVWQKFLKELIFQQHFWYF